MNLVEEISQIEPLLARRFERLGEAERELAAKGIGRHFNACRKYGCDADPSAIREIIEDAAKGIAVWA